jgi:hypothetical protein
LEVPLSCAAPKPARQRADYRWNVTPRDLLGDRSKVGPDQSGRMFR